MNNIPLRKAKIEEAEDILNFYKNIINSIKDSEFQPRWNDSYPNLEFIQTSIEKEELYICINGNGIISSLF